MDRIQYMLNLCEDENNTIMTPTILYNEGWLLRIILDWFSFQKNIEHILAFNEESRWYSEALLPTPFKARYRGDRNAEAYTHADGIIGNFEIGYYGKTDIKLDKFASQFVVIEAKMFSRISKRIKNFEDYDQVTRTLACMAEIIRRDDVLLLIAPHDQIKKNYFTEYIKKENIKLKVLKRIKNYKDKKEIFKKERWFNNKFLPFLEIVNIEILSWESILEFIKTIDKDKFKFIDEFYDNCIRFNKNNKDK